MIITHGLIGVKVKLMLLIFAFLKQETSLFSALQTMPGTVSRKFNKLYFGMPDAISGARRDERGKRT